MVSNKDSRYTCLPRLFALAILAYNLYRRTSHHPWPEHSIGSRHVITIIEIDITGCFHSKRYGIRVWILCHGSIPRWASSNLRGQELRINFFDGGNQPAFREPEDVSGLYLYFFKVFDYLLDCENLR